MQSETENMAERVSRLERIIELQAGLLERLTNVVVGHQAAVEGLSRLAGVELQRQDELTEVTWISKTARLN